MNVTNSRIDRDSLSGVFVSLVTPFEDEMPRLDWLAENVAALDQTEIRGYLALGGNAEAQTLSEDERISILDLVLSNRRAKLVIAGVSEESTRQAIERSKEYADHGADFLRVLPPHYFAKHMTDEVLLRFYEEVADAAPIPVVLYNVPQLTGGVRLSPESVKILARHANIAGVKDSSPEGIYAFLSAVRGIPDFKVLAGSASIFFPALVAGASGGDMSLANFLPDACCELYSAFCSGDLEAARTLHQRLYAINAGVSGQFGVSGVKSAMDMVGLRGGAPRRPLAVLGPAQNAAVKELLESEGFRLDPPGGNSVV